MHCHSSSNSEIHSNQGCIALVGHPNVGKSVIFQYLTGQHVQVANYPGTTVELARGALRNLEGVTVLDTPGVVAFPPLTEDEQVTARVFLEEPLRAILQVGDAKNLRRTLLLTVQLAEMGIPLVLDLNMMDEAEARGVTFDPCTLSEYLTIPIVTTTATRKKGISQLIETLNTASPPQFRITYPAEIESAVAETCVKFPNAPISSRALVLLWLSGDLVTEAWLKSNLDDAAFHDLWSLRDTQQLSFNEPLSSAILKTRLAIVEQIASAVLSDSGQGWRGLSTMLGHLTTHPWFGIIILGFVLLSLYWFVGIFGAGTLVDLLENRLFGDVLNPWLSDLVQKLIPIPLVADFLVGEYGLWTLGMTYAFSLILPIVTTFFLAFGILEDSGYLPRLAALSNRLFQFLGLNGKAVLPMILGLGCVTMAALTTRVLESKRERLLVTLLLALAIPCSAQLGVVMGMLAGISFTATLIWGSVIFLVLLAIGWLAAHILPGERTKLLVELPPLRWPLVSNILLKSLARLEWYLKEVVPLFLLGTAIMFILDRSGFLAVIIRTGEPLVTGWLGLPSEASAAFLMGFLRRDFGATGLFVMEARGLLSPLQVVVAMVTITLFIPCIASVMMIARERGWRTAGFMLTMIIPLAFLVGGLLNRILFLFRWGL